MTQVTILKAQDGYVVQDAMTGTTTVKVTFVSLVEYLSEIFHEGLKVEIQRGN
jgi:hypothetical protein